MPVTVYVDILLCVNLYINYLLLQLTQKALRQRFRKKRVLLASAIGAVCSLVMLLPPLPGLLLFAIRLLLALGIMFAASGERRILLLLRQTALFFAANVLLCGVMLLLWNLFLPNFIGVNNGVVYLDISAVALLLLTTLSYGLLQLLDRLRPKAEEKHLFRLRLSTARGQVELQGLLDSGNSLADPFTGCPAAVVWYPAVREVLPEPMAACLAGAMEQRLPPEALSPCPGVRWLPCSTVRSTELLPAFFPEKLECFRQGQWQQAGEVLLAVTARPLSPDYQLLLHPEISWLPTQTDSRQFAERKEGVKG